MNLCAPTVVNAAFVCVFLRRLVATMMTTTTTMIVMVLVTANNETQAAPTRKIDRPSAKDSNAIACSLEDAVD